MAYKITMTFIKVIKAGGRIGIHLVLGQCRISGVETVNRDTVCNQDLMPLKHHVKYVTEAAR